MRTALGDGRVDVAAVRARHPLPDVVAASGVELRPVGRGFMGCCPFHDDTTASLSVDGVPDRYHCFGCGASGDVIDYTAQLHHLPFKEAVAHLDGHHTPDTQVTATGRLRIVPDREVHGPTPERAHQIHAMAWEHYTRPVAHATAEAWLTQHRRIPVHALEEHLGHAVAGAAGNGWTRLADDLRHRGVTDDELVALDLARVTRQGRLIDTLRNRIILPVADDQNRILGFLGRDTSGDPAAPKYRNPTRTVTYDKAHLLYRPDAGRPVPDGARLVIVEGPLDALAVTAHAAHNDRMRDFVAVTACGTAATPHHADHITALRRGPIVIALDADPAGDQGTLRWVDLLARQRLQPVHVAELPTGRDPADWLAQYPRSGLQDFDPSVDAWAPAPPGAHLARLTLADSRRHDPSPRVVTQLQAYAQIAHPDDLPVLVAQAEWEMTRQGWNPDHTFTRALRVAGLPPAPEPPPCLPDPPRWLTQPPPPIADRGLDRTL